MRIAVALVAATLVGSFPAHAQERKASGHGAVYKVEFDIGHGDDADSQPDQHFSMLIHESQKGIFQAMNRIPTSTGASHYTDVGANIECTVHKSDSKAALSASIELTSITGWVSLGALTEPIIGQWKALIHTSVALGTPTLVVDGRNVAPLMRRVEATVTRGN